jgi:hypothetical protein
MKPTLFFFLITLVFTATNNYDHKMILVGFGNMKTTSQTDVKLKETNTLTSNANEQNEYEIMKAKYEKNFHMSMS